MTNSKPLGPFLENCVARAGVDLATLAGLPPWSLRGCSFRLDATLSAELRLERMLEWARIAARELAGKATLEETLTELSDFADAACEAALQAAVLLLAPRFGSPRDADGNPAQIIVFGMGKLGGRELNFSSDIDLIFAYTVSGQTDGNKVISNEEYFAKLVQEVVQLLAARTQEGFVFRVDLMLRPFGSVGAVAISVDAMEQYYQSHGRDWERYALIKARPIAGDKTAGALLLARLTPFVYRRYLDFDAIAGLREMKRRIAADAGARGLLADDLKLGNGGIRELEFIVQSFQLVRGGQDSRLRGNQLRPMLARLAELDHLSLIEAQSLDAAYVLLRRTENAVQMWADEQTHALPTSPARREALALALGFQHWAGLSTVLAQHRATVSRVFGDLFDEPDVVPQRPAAQVTTALWRGEGNTDQLTALFTSAGYSHEPLALVQAVCALRDSSRVRGGSDAASERLSALVSLLAEEALSLREVRNANDPGVAFLRALQVVTAVVGRSTYLALLRESANARGNLLRLCAASPWIAATLARHPILLDQLLDARTLYSPPDRQQLRDGLLPRMAELAVGDVEAAMNLLRQYVQETTLRVAAADVVHALQLPKVSDRLTWLAEAVLEAAVNFAERDMHALHGVPLRADGKLASFAVIGYGKLGGIEMGYGSDLDLVFVHDAEPADADTVGGDRPMPQAAWMARLAQRVVHLLNTQTHLGRAYEVDMQLRPNGNAGLPVVALSAYADYQANHAWVWEHQALTRARHIVGAPTLGATFEAIRCRTLSRVRDSNTLSLEVSAMRAKMRAHLDKSKDQRWDVKQGPGGLVDVEFIVQYAVLAFAHDNPSVMVFPDIWRQLEALTKVGAFTLGSATMLLDAQRIYRAYLHRCTLQGLPSDAANSDFLPQREAVCATWHTVFGVNPEQVPTS